MQSVDEMRPVPNTQRERIGDNQEESFKKSPLYRERVERTIRLKGWLMKRKDASAVRCQIGGS